MTYHYSAQNYNKEHMARAIGHALPISTKQSIMICNVLRKKTVAKAKNILNEVISLKHAIPFTRFTNALGHKPGGMGPGRYPVKASSHFLSLLENVEANAQFKGLNTSDLIISHISSQAGGNSWRHGRQSRRRMKITHIEIVVEESKKKKEPEKKEQKPKEKKTEQKEEKKQ
jgi:large subunit ribosomal protein L22